jgi:anti-sigma B factor antagonist
MFETQPPDGTGASPASGEGGSLAAPFRCDITEDGDGVVAVVQGELDLASAPEFTRRIQQVLTGPPASLTLDLTALTFIDSSGLGALCRIQEDAVAQETVLQLTGVPHHARRVLEITGLTGLFGLDDEMG